MRINALDFSLYQMSVVGHQSIVNNSKELTEIRDIITNEVLPTVDSY